MARSVEELRHESERSRAELAATVGRLRDQISDTAKDIRHKVSPQHIKSEVSEYVSHKTQSWIEGLKQQIMDNPMRAVAAGAAVGIPLLRLARGVPLPLLMIGAGLALTSKTVRDRAADSSGPVMDRAGEMLEELAEGARAMQGDATEKLSSPRSRAAGMAGDAQDRAAGLADDLRTGATKAASFAGEKLKSGIDAAKDAATNAPDQARQTIGDNAALIGGLGIAIGAIIAAALPETKAEGKVMGRASDGVKQAAAAAAQSGFEAAKETTTSAADAAAEKVAEADLGTHASRMTQDVAGILKEAADDVIKAAFRPSQNTNT
ncbi:DUF3618 domain-containing protein [Bradyrhizobium japonicum]|uniref:DUF3618 domain-containing protein n=1 Tax=Bradyrhizobium japonicum TaxID=375 RepID=UPI00209E016C|nr:DUF3618 domain-containing protein [Bradyrhizobium japonicum]MCP1766006.1 ElaB/YqjD/DUF883 family membrane-anchored ribosome-binding protein [Bradyrhizobium japonicum]MCP1788143.1 ElaB/YqjD/DUF883 family membrane-anchored ribosome-binding protein [Bradyrhizobium japonicum]MCP1810019.1 ElaB/YqjD/DUF883 family membrane-anchored ribosome-binding protein [Bradyrhizobium japonicum]MCP1818953.1 ElaB/YqjD/DUF883 family membrane-anchored ribosome-binding protein [Bradyrhizobium japonicum]MCP1869537.